MLYPRHIASRVVEALADTPIVLLHGARQVGKSTLVQDLVAGARPARYVTLDDLSTLSAARSDPVGFLSGLGGPVALDEVQRAPGLFLAMKSAVDRDRTPGRFLLTGSANILLLPQLADTLVGRMEAIALWPLSQSEIERTPGLFVDGLFAQAQASHPDAGLLPCLASDSKAVVVRRALVGGYPEPLARRSRARRRAWFESYITTLLQRDVRDLAQIDRLAELPRLLALLASRATGLLNMADIARGLGLPQTTVRRYLALLESTFLVQLLPAWSTNVGARVTKAPKLIVSDTGLMAHLLGRSADDSHEELDALNLTGPLVENLVVTELRKQASWSVAQPGLYHYRTASGTEVDLLLVDDRGTVVGVEVKASASVSDRDFRGLRRLGDDLSRPAGGPHGLRLGIVLYCGHSAIPFGERLWALPIGALWA